MDGALVHISNSVYPLRNNYCYLNSYCVSNNYPREWLQLKPLIKQRHLLPNTDKTEQISALGSIKILDALEKCTPVN